MIQLQNITFSFPTQTLFEDLTWQITPGERYGLVGPNGAGKTTLLKLISGALSPDRGVVVRPRGVRVGYLSQAPQIPSEDVTVREILLRPLAYLKEAEARLQEIQRLLSAPDISEGEASALAEELSLLEERFRQGGGYSLSARISELVTAFGFSPEEILDRPIAPLSGGEKSRIMLAEVLLGQPDLLLLDEPTNHLDIEGTEHLEEILEKFPGTILIVSHDRYLLDRVVRRIVEVDHQKLNFYTGGYSDFTRAREKRLASEWKVFEQQKEEIARTEEFIRKNLAGQKTNQAKSRRKALEKMERVMRPEDVWSQASRIGLRFESGSRAPNIIAEAKGLTKSYQDKKVLSGMDLIITRGEKVGIIGPNGSGKSTLLKCLIGKLIPEKGFASIGSGVTLGYLDQEVADKVSSKSAVEELMDAGAASGTLTNPDATRHYLARFRFFEDEVFRPTKSFSGGERTRLALAKIMLTPKNALALDEPTNHLDIPAREVLEKTLESYDGTLLVVSHDRYFLDQVAQKIIKIEDGRCEVFLGNYSEYRSRLKKLPPEAPAPKKETKNAPPEEQNPSRESREERQARHARDRERKKLERRLFELEEEISSLEAECQKWQEAMTSAGGSWEKLAEYTRQEKESKAMLEARIQEWEELGATLERG